MDLAELALEQVRRVDGVSYADGRTVVQDSETLALKNAEVDRHSRERSAGIGVRGPRPLSLSTGAVVAPTPDLPLVVGGAMRSVFDLVATVPDDGAVAQEHVADFVEVL